ncbi:hypothetical protein ACVWW2_006915 [Bradyrhizobium sp. LM4.3]
MMVSQDQRVGAKPLFRDERFKQATKMYLVSAIDMASNNPASEVDRRELANALTEFVAYIRSLFPNHKRGILTVLRREYGRALTELYKDTLTLQKLLEAASTVQDIELEPLSLPEQKSSPIYTKVENERIVLDSGHALHPFLQKEAIAQTRAYLRKELSELESTLRGSNVDRKYVEAFSRLQTLIDFKDDSGAISFGLHVKLISNITGKIESELSDVLSVQISSTLTHSAYFAAQYKDWVEFLQNAQSYPSRESIDAKIDDALAQVEKTLFENPENVDKRIPQSFQMVRDILSASPEDRKQAIYAGVRGVENVCIAAIAYAYEQAKRLTQDSASKARPALVRLGAGAIIMIALSVISNFMPVIKNAAELSWILDNLPKIEKIGKILNK